MMLHRPDRPLLATTLSGGGAGSRKQAGDGQDMGWGADRKQDKKQVRKQTGNRAGDQQEVKWDIDRKQPRKLRRHRK